MYQEGRGKRENAIETTGSKIVLWHTVWVSNAVKLTLSLQQLIIQGKKTPKNSKKFHHLNTLVM